MTRLLLLTLLSAPVMAMEPIQEQAAFRLEKSEAAIAEEFGNNEAFTLVTQKRMLEIMRINFKSALKVFPKVDKDKVKALKEEIKKANAEIRKIDNLIKQGK